MNGGEKDSKQRQKKQVLGHPTLRSTHPDAAHIRTKAAKVYDRLWQQPTIIFFLYTCVQTA